MLQVHIISIFSISYRLFHEDIQHIMDLSFAGANSSQLGKGTEVLCACISFNKENWKAMKASKYLKNCQKSGVEVSFSKVTWPRGAQSLNRV